MFQRVILELILLIIGLLLNSVICIRLKIHIYFEKPDVLLHLAWKAGFIHYSDAHIMDLPKHYQFIQKMAQRNITKIAIMGSMHEIGFYEGSIDENTPCKPESFYGIAKNALREVAKIYCKQNEKNTNG